MDFQRPRYESLSEAIKFRDEALKVLGERKKNAIPAHVLKGLGLSAPVAGISRDAAGTFLAISSGVAKQVGAPSEFPFAFLKKEDAYAAAIECIEASLK